MYKQKGFLYKTVATVLIVILAIIGIHVYFNMTIQTKRFTEDWGKSINIGGSENSWNPLIGNLDGEIIVNTFNKDGRLNYFLVKKDGTLIKSGTINDDSIRVSSKWNVHLANNKLLFIDDNNLYMSVFDKEKAFTKPSLIMNNVERFQTDIVNGQIIIEGYSKDRVFVSKLVGNNIENIIDIENDKNTYKVLYKEINNEKQVFVVNQVSGTIEVSVGKLVDGEITEFKTISEKQMSLNSSLNDFEIVESNGKYYLLYESTQVAGGSRSVYADIRVIDKDTLKTEAEKYIMDGGDIKYVSSQGEDYILKKNGSEVSIISTGINLKNKYFVNANVYEINISEDLAFSDPEFISNTENLSIKPNILDLEGDQYLVFLDITSDENFELNINSQNGDFIKNSLGFKKEDYKNSFIKAITAPFYAISYIVMTTGIVNMIYIVFLFLGLYAITKMLRIRSEKLKFVLYILLYLIINMILFDNNFYTPGAMNLMPDILRLTAMRYIMPLIINVISGIVLYVFYKERNRYEFLTYIVFFILIDILISNLFYVPFEVLRILSK